MPRSGQDPRRLQAGRRTAGDRRAHPRRAEIGLHRPAAAGQGSEAAGQLPGLQGRRPTARPILWWSPIPTSWPTGSGCASPGLLRPADRDAVQRQRPVRRQPDRHAGRRRRADRPARRAATAITRSRWSNEMQSEAEAKFRQTEQTLQKHLDAVEKQLAHPAPGQQQRAGGGQCAGGDHAAAARAIDAARKDVLDTREKLRAVQTGAEPRHLAPGDRTAPVQHRPGPGRC